MEATWKCFAAAKAYSVGKTENNSIVISAGLATGPMWVVRGVDVFGNTANVSFELGENMASKELLVDETVANACSNDSRYRFDWRSGEIVGEERRYAKVMLNGAIDQVFPWNGDPFAPPVVNPPINSEEPNDFVRMIEDRQKAQGKNIFIFFFIEIFFVMYILFTQTHDTKEKQKVVQEFQFLMFIFSNRTCLTIFFILFLFEKLTNFFLFFFFYFLVFVHNNLLFKL